MPIDRPKSLVYALVGGCLLAAASGCQLHRTGHGFLLSSNWSIECVTSPRLALKFDKDQSQCPAADPTDAPATKRAFDPELLPWRTRLKGRLANRLFGHGSPNDSASKAGAPADTELAIAAAPLPPPPAEPNDGNTQSTEH
ncbi:MAG: hypothetical protein ABFC96_14225 [Thermoguttaceae bacterium]